MKQFAREQKDLRAHVLKKNHAWLLSHPEITFTPKQQKRFNQYVQRLKEGEPLAYILGEQWFYGRPFIVTRDTLIPRPETELLVELALQKITGSNPKSLALHGKPSNPLIIDIGTGSGCIAISLAAESHKEAKVIAVDISPAALIIARKNANQNNVANKIEFVEGDLLKPVISVISKKYAHQKNSRSTKREVIILANLPYATTDEWLTLSPSITNHEPRIAIDGGQNGTKLYCRFFQQLKKLVGNSSVKLFVFLEIDPRRKSVLKQLVSTTLPKWNATFHKDLTDKWRVLKLEQ